MIKKYVILILIIPSFIFTVHPGRSEKNLKNQRRKKVLLSESSIKKNFSNLKKIRRNKTELFRRIDPLGLTVNTNNRR